MTGAKKKGELCSWTQERIRISIGAEETVFRITFQIFIFVLRLKVVAAYHSGLEHTFLWIVESENAHSIQDLMVESKVAQWNATKIVPLRTLENVVEYCQGLEQ